MSGLPSMSLPMIVVKTSPIPLCLTIPLHGFYFQSPPPAPLVKVCPSRGSNKMMLWYLALVRLLKDDILIEWTVATELEMRNQRVVEVLYPATSPASSCVGV
jgi:hypothetical protein